MKMKKLLSVIMTIAIAISLLPTVTLPASAVTADHTITSSDGSTFYVDGVTTTPYSTLNEALSAILSITPTTVIQLGNSLSDPLILAKSTETLVNNKLKSAIYTGWVTLNDSGTNEYGLVIPTGVTVSYSGLIMKNAVSASTATTATYLSGGSLDILVGTEITISTSSIDYKSRGVFNAGSGTVTMSGGTINSAQIGIYCGAGTLNVSGGDITATSTSNVDPHGIMGAGNN